MALCDCCRAKQLDDQSTTRRKKMKKYLKNRLERSLFSLCFNVLLHNLLVTET